MKIERRLITQIHCYYFYAIIDMACYSGLIKKFNFVFDVILCFLFSVFTTSIVSESEKEKNREIWQRPNQACASHYEYIIQNMHRGQKNEQKILS